jgi:hypothetical protein
MSNKVKEKIWCLSWAQKADLSYFDILSRNASQGPLRYTINARENLERTLHPVKGGSTTRSELTGVELVLQFAAMVTHFTDLLMRSCSLC